MRTDTTKNYMKQERSEMGNWFARHCSRKTLVAVRMPNLLLRLMYMACEDAGLTQAAFIEQTIEELYGRYVTENELLPIYPTTSVCTEHFVFRVNDATRSMLNELAEVSDLSQSEAIRAVLTLAVAEYYDLP